MTDFFLLVSKQFIGWCWLDIIPQGQREIHTKCLFIPKTLKFEQRHPRPTC